ncbi:MAG: 16S rRNA (guanine(966)-N(2))-methyltransferase RsmD [Prevotella sp.]|nr:16S rRNA (guanine(966)-N(2))-methyltransferase RsmD [Prevotella sp.]MBQ8487985.1 16S rRNA (guanine(966)-N(2))-methyltransferase RsmD [Prevotella sp.]
MRIITGKYKGRHFEIPRSFKARPTTDFAKENIFNVLIQYVDFDGAEALDLFSGTGSITFELLSRGCARVVSVEQDRDHHRFICDCLKKLRGEHEEESVLPLRGDVFRFVKSCRQQFDFIFADPPYALKELSTIPDLIFEKQLLKPDGVFVLEHGKDYNFEHHPRFREHRQYGSVNFSIFTSAAPASAADSPSGAQ